jgi:hypothetical protein
MFLLKSIYRVKEHGAYPQCWARITLLAVDVMSLFGVTRSGLLKVLCVTHLPTYLYLALTWPHA